MAILRSRASHPAGSMPPLCSLPRVPFTQSLPSFSPSVTGFDTRRLLDSDRLLKNTHRKGILSVIKSKTKPKKQRLVSLPANPPSVADLSKGMRLFRTLFGVPQAEKKPLKVKVVKLPQRFKDSPMRRPTIAEEPYVPQGKTATSSSFQQLVLLSTTIRRPSSYRW